LAEQVFADFSHDHAELSSGGHIEGFFIEIAQRQIAILCRPLPLASPLVEIGHDPFAGRALYPRLYRRNRGPGVLDSNHGRHLYLLHFARVCFYLALDHHCLGKGARFVPRCAQERSASTLRPPALLGTGEFNLLHNPSSPTFAA